MLQFLFTAAKGPWTLRVPALRDLQVCSYALKCSCRLLTAETMCVNAVCALQHLTSHPADNSFLKFGFLVVFHVSFFIFITTIGLNIIFGIIVDTFSELRDLKVCPSNVFISSLSVRSFPCRNGPRMM